MKTLANTDEIMYHTGLSRQMIHGATIAVIPGDPARVPILAKALDEKAYFLATSRDYTSYLSFVDDTPILIMSTGMGGPCVTFAVEELARLGIDTFLRVGTTGAIQENISPGTVIINYASVRNDGASRAYAPVNYPAVATPSIVRALEESAAALHISYTLGISISTDSFWPGQERYDSFGGYVLNRLKNTLSEYRTLGCTNYEMENATLFTLTSVLGLKSGSICGVVAKRTDSESIVPKEIYKQAETAFCQIVAYAMKHFLLPKSK